MRPHPLQVVRRAFLLLLLLLPVIIAPARAQSLAHYGVVRSTGVAYSSIAATGTSVSTWRNGTSLDDNRSVNIGMGFDFWYDGKAYKQFAVSTNGFIDVSGSTANGSGTGPFGAQNTTFSSSASYTALAFAPIYDDLIIPAASSLANAVKYQITGSTGTHVLTVEWIGVQVKGASSGSLNFQVKLFEADGSVQFNYGAMTNSGVTPSYSCGINAPAMSNPPLATQLLTQQTANTATFSSTPQNALSALPAASTRLQFTAAQTVTPAAPSNVSVTNRTQTGARVTWTDNSSTETFFTVQYSLNALTYVTAGTVQSTTTASTGTTYLLDITGLTAETAYSVRVQAANEASAPASSGTAAFNTRPRGVYSVASGKWSAGTTWSTGLVPSSTDTVTISDGTIDTVNVSTTIHRLNVGEGGSGVLRFEPTSGRTLTVAGDVNVRAFAGFTTPASGTQAGHQLIVLGDLHVNGNLDFSTNAGACLAFLQFTGPGNRVFDGGGTVDLHRLTVALADTDSVLTMSPQTLTFDGATTLATGVITLTTGELHLSGTYPLNMPLLTSNFITAGAGFWLDDPNVIVTQASGVVLNGRLAVSRGVMRVGDAVNEHLSFQGVSPRLSIQIDGGSLLVAGGINGTGTSKLRFIQQGGLVEVGTVGNTSSSAGFSVGPGGTADLVAGTLEIAYAKAAGGAGDWAVDSVLSSGFSHVLKIGDPTIDTGQSYLLTGTAWRVQTADGFVPYHIRLVNFTARNGFSSAGQDTVQLTGQVNIFGSDFSLNGPLQLGSATLVLADAFYLPLPGQEGFAPKNVIFNGGVTGNLASLVCDCLGGIVFNSTSSETLVTRDLVLGQGPAAPNGRVAVGISGQLSTITIKHGVLTGPLLFLPALAYDMVYTGFTAQDTTGFEVPASRQLRNFTVDGPLVVRGGPITCTGNVSFTRILDTSFGNELIAGTNSAFAPFDGAVNPTGFIRGPVIAQFHTTGTPTPIKWFPTGHDALYRPIGIDGENTFGTNLSDTLEVIGTPGGAFASPPLAVVGIEPAYRIAPQTTPLSAGARISVHYDGDDAPWSFGSAQLAGATTIAGAYSDLGGQVIGIGLQGQIRDTADVGAGQKFFRIADRSPTVRLMQPNNHQFLMIGQASTIDVQAFSSTLITHLDLYLSRNGPTGPWEPIATAQPDSTVYHWIPTSPATVNAYVRVVVTDTLHHTNEDVSDTAFVIQTLESTGAGPRPAPVLALAAPWPNPTTGVTTLAFTLPRSGVAMLTVHDLQGRLAARIVSGAQGAGRHAVTWQPPARLAGGLYLVRLDTPEGALVRRLVLLR